MNAPIWRIVLSYMVLFFAVQRTATAVMLGLSEMSALVIAGYALQTAGALFLWASLRWLPRCILPALAVTGALVALSAIVNAAVGATSAGWAVMQVMAAALATAGFMFLLKLGLADSASRGAGREREAPR